MKRILMACLIMLLTSGGVFADTVNINTANAEEIATQLKGVGMSKAKAIVQYREEQGKFETVDDLALVKGIGLRTVDINRDKMTTDSDQSNEE